MIARGIVWAAMFVTAAGPLLAQSTALRLRPATDTHAEEFTSIGSVRELSDGRVLVIDGADDRLVLLDFRTGTATMIGRKGSGPSEYRDLGTLVPFGGDSTLIADLSNRRWILLAGSSIVTTIAPGDPLVQLAGTQLLGADRAGHLLVQRPVAADAPTAGVLRGSYELLRVDRRRVTADTLERLRASGVAYQAVGPPERRGVRSMSIVYSVPEQAVLFTDGWLAAARQDPYRVDWLPPGAPWRRGSAIPWAAPPVTEAEKSAWIARFEAFTGTKSRFSVTDLPWAESVPPFREGALLAVPDGSLLIAKDRWSKSVGSEYDLVDRRGALTAVLRLPENESVAGFGARTVYIAVTDADGVKRLRRHPWSRE